MKGLFQSLQGQIPQATAKHATSLLSKTHQPQRPRKQTPSHRAHTSNPPPTAGSASWPPGSLSRLFHLIRLTEQSAVSCRSARLRSTFGAHQGHHYLCRRTPPGQNCPLPCQDLVCSPKLPILTLKPSDPGLLFAGYSRTFARVSFFCGAPSHKRAQENNQFWPQS